MGEDRRLKWNRTLQAAPVQLSGMLASLHQALPGLRIVWRLSTPICNCDVCFGLSLNKVNQMLQYSNSVIISALAEQAWPNLKVLDFWHYNINRCGSYDGSIHHEALIDHQR